MSKTLTIQNASSNVLIPFITPDGRLSWDKNEYLKHYGILGMKWGIRKEREAATRSKMGKIAKRPITAMRQTDIKRAKARNQPLPMRVAKNAGRAAVSILVGDILSGQVNYAKMSKADVAARLSSIATSAVVNTAVQDALAASMAKNYTDDGKVKKGVKDRLITKEDAIEAGIGGVLTAAPFLGELIKTKAFNTASKRSQNEAQFNNLMRQGRILSQPAKNFSAGEVLYSEKGMTIYDKIRP